MKYHFILIYIFAFLNTQTIDAQIVIHERYASGQPKIQYHIRQKDTFRTDKLFENGHFFRIEWQDSVHVFYENGVISQKTYLLKRLKNRDRGWLNFAMNVVENSLPMAHLESDLNKRTYYPDGNLETELIWTGDSLVKQSLFFPNGQLYASLQYHHPNFHLFKCLQIKDNEVVQQELDTITKIKKQLGYRNQQLVQYEELQGLGENVLKPFNLLKQVLNDSTGKLNFSWKLDSLNYKLDKDNALCLYGFRNAKTDWAITPRYESVKKFNNAYFIVSQNNKYGVIDESGNITTPLKWDFLEDISYSKFNINIDIAPSIWKQDKTLLFDSEIHKPNLAARLVCRKGNLYGVIDCFGNTILEPVYQQIRQYKNNLYEIQKGKFWGLVDQNGQIVVEPKYVGIFFTPYKDLFYIYDTICVPSKETYNSIQENNNLHLDEKQIQDFYKEAILHRKFGLINDKGKTLLPCIFEDLIAETENRCFNIAIYNLNEPEYRDYFMDAARDPFWTRIFTNFKWIPS